MCLQFLWLLEFSSSFPARALPAVGSANSAHSEIQRDSLAFTRSTLRVQIQARVLEWGAIAFSEITHQSAAIRAHV